MSFDYQIDVARRLVISRGWGALTDQDLLSHAASLAKDPRFQRDMRQLVDFREVARIEFATGTIHRMVGVNPFGAGARRAFVLSSAGAYGMARMYQSLSDPSPDKVELFRELEPALAWLGLTDDASEVRAVLAAIRPSPP